MNTAGVRIKIVSPCIFTDLFLKNKLLIQFHNEFHTEGCISKEVSDTGLNSLIWTWLEVIKMMIDHNRLKIDEKTVSCSLVWLYYAKPNN